MLKCIFCTILCILNQINAKRQISISPNVNDELEIEITNSGSDQHFLIIEKPGRNFEKAYTFNRTYQYKDSNTGKYPLDPIHFTIFGIVNNTKVHESSKIAYFWCTSLRRNLKATQSKGCSFSCIISIRFQSKMQFLFVRFRASNKSLHSQYYASSVYYWLELWWVKCSQWQGLFFISHFFE